MSSGDSSYKSYEKPEAKSISLDHVTGIVVFFSNLAPSVEAGGSFVAAVVPDGLWIVLV